MLTALMALVAVVVGGPDSRPTPPIVVRNHCGFEYGCEFRHPWLATGSLRAFRAQGDTTTAFPIVSGDSLSFLRADTVVDSIGIARVLSPQPVLLEGSQTMTAAAGDTLLILEYDGEGWYRVWSHGHYGWVEAPWCGTASEVTLLRPPSETWWVLVRNERGLTGWLAIANTERDGCGFSHDAPIRISWEHDQ
jgi:hypothetical protein